MYRYPRNLADIARRISRHPTLLVINDE